MQIRTGNIQETFGTGFVVYSRMDEALKAIESLNGFNVMNRYLICNFYRVSYHKNEQNVNQKIKEEKKNIDQRLKEKYNLRTPRN